MWLLESDDSEDKLQRRILLDVVFTVGRKGCNLNLDDKSVSRKHATLTATIHGGSSVTDRPVLHLKDTSSFGTRINKKKVEQNVSTPLNDGDKIIFGSPKSSFWVRFSPLVVTSSCLEKPLKVELDRTLRTLGGKVVAEWGPSCTHLVMQNLSVTVKVICALAAQRSVVTINYFKKLIESIKNVEVPSPEECSFLPKVSDSLAVRQVSTFQSNIKRKTLFSGITFIFLSASQMKKMKEALNLAGGNVKLHLEKNNDITDQDLVEDGNIIMSPPSTGINMQWVSHIQAVLESYGKRMITDAEIGHAVLSCSVKQYCNPDVEQGKSLDPLASQTMRTQSQTQDLLNSSTQSQMSMILNMSRSRFNESTSGSKSILSQIEEGSLTKKASDLTEELTVEPSTKKRRRSSDETGASVEDTGEDVLAKKQCLFKIPVLDESHSAPRRSISTTLVPDTESQQTFIRPKPTTVVVDSDPEDEDDEPRPTFSTSKSSKHEESTTRSKRGSSLFGGDRSSLNDKDSEEKDQYSSSKILAQDTPSSLNCSLLGKKKTSLLSVVEDSERAEQGPSVSDKEVSVKIKKEVVDPSIEKVLKQSKPLFQDPLTQEVKEETQHENFSKKEESSRGSTQRQALTDINLPEGFLTTRLPIKNQVTKIKREEELEEKDLPQNCIETVFTDLVSKRSRPKPPANPDNGTSSQAPEGYSYYRGQLVRNFKKFRKNALPRGFSLPRIIGGSDLVNHLASRSKEIDEWMRQSKEQESQQNEDDRRAEELFNWDSRGKGKKWSR